MKFSVDQVKTIVNLANLNLTDEELSEYPPQLSAILDYIDQLNELDTTGVNPTYNVSDTGSLNTDFTQKITSSTSLTQQEALQNSTQQQNGFFVTKGVFENE